MLHDFDHDGLNASPPLRSVVGRAVPLRALGSALAAGRRHLRALLSCASAAAIVVGGHRGRPRRAPARAPRAPLGRRRGRGLPPGIRGAARATTSAWASEFDLTANISLGPFARFTHVIDGREGYATLDLPYVSQPAQDTDSIQWWTAGSRSRSTSGATARRAPRRASTRAPKESTHENGRSPWHPGLGRSPWRARPAPSDDPIAAQLLFNEVGATDASTSSSSTTPAARRSTSRATASPTAATTGSRRLSRTDSLPRRHHRPRGGTRGGDVRGRVPHGRDALRVRARHGWVGSPRPAARACT